MKAYTSESTLHKDKSFGKNSLTIFAHSFRVHMRTYQALLEHPQTPWISRILLGIAIAYALSPIDLIPDFLPIVGHLDDVLIIPLLLGLAIVFVPAEVNKECRLKAAWEIVKGASEIHGSEME